MRGYRSAWQATVAVVTAVALVAGISEIGWPSMLGAVGAITVLGASSGLAWIEVPERRWRMVRRLALWFGVSATLLLGLTSVLGAWTLLVVPALGALSPDLVGWAAGHLRWSPAPGALEQQWRRTTRQLATHGADPATVLALVEERARLLDELEVRDPARFDAMLAGTGRRERQER